MVDTLGDECPSYSGKQESDARRGRNERAEPSLLSNGRGERKQQCDIQWYMPQHLGGGGGGHFGGTMGCFWLQQAVEPAGRKIGGYDIHIQKATGEGYQTAEV